MKSFKQFLKDADGEELTEQAIARYGNFGLDLTVGIYTAETVTNIQWKYCCDVILTKKSPMVSKLELRKLESGRVYIVGYWETIDAEYVFTRVAEIKLSDEHICGKNYKAVYLARVAEEYRGLGISTKLYELLVTREKLNLISDVEQYFGARKLWSKLSYDATLTVDIIDTKACLITFHDVKIKHGPHESKWLDERIDSYNDDKSHLRMILKHID
jgi:hypothetical protein